VKGLRGSLAAGLVAVAAVALATAGLAERSTRSVDAELARHRAKAQRTLVPRTRPDRTPKSAETSRDQSGSSQGPGKHIVGTVTEHHRIHGSGSISVTSGAVDEGSGGSDNDADRFGPPIRHRLR